MSAQSSVIELLRAYTAPRGLLVALLFVLAALVRVPSVLLAVAVHLLERSSARLVACCESIPAQPAHSRRDQHRGGAQR